MSHSNRFRPISLRGVALVLAAAAFSSPGMANTGKIDFAVGDVTVRGADGTPRRLLKGTEVKTGDNISTHNGRAQIRFSDGSYVSLQPNTEFDIRDFVFEGKADGSEKVFFQLLKGALRTVTGLVGRVHRDSYKIATPTATIGIRGTGGLIRIGDDGSTRVTGTSGVWSLTNNGGSIDIPAGTSGYAGPNTNVPPERTSQGPTLPPPQAGPLQTYVAGENRDSQGNPSSIPLPPVSSTPTMLGTGPGFLVGGFVDPCKGDTTCNGGKGGNQATLSPPAVAAVFDGSGRLIQFVMSNGSTSDGTYALVAGTGTHAEFGADGVLAWGRWTGDVSKDGAPFSTFPGDGGLHYVVGQPTPIATLPIGVTFTYHLIGATQPTLAFGVTPPGTFSGTLVGDFLNNKVGLNFTVTTSATAINMQTAGFSTGLNPSSEVGINRGASTFGGTIVATTPSTNTAVISGFFAGSVATHAGMSYLINNSITGVAAFQR
jgi:hypothetical protein